MLFYVDYSVEDATECEKKIEDLGNFEIWYNVDPKINTCFQTEDLR